MTAWVSAEVGSRREREGDFVRNRRIPTADVHLALAALQGGLHALPLILYLSAAPPAEQRRCFFLLTSETASSHHKMSAKKGRTEVREGGTFNVLFENSSFFFFFLFEREISVTVILTHLLEVLSVEQRRISLQKK